MTFLAASALDDFSSSAKVALVVTLATDLAAEVASKILPSFKICSFRESETLPSSLSQQLGSHPGS